MSVANAARVRVLRIGGAAAILVLCGATGSAAQDLTKLPNIVDKVAASVVSITFDPPADPKTTDSKPTAQMGSGIVLSPDGFIATAANVVVGATAVNVTLADGKTLVGAVVGADSRSNVAILKVQPSTLLKEAQFADSDLVRRGQPIFLIGDPFGLRGSVSIGVISAKGRLIDPNSPYEYFQTDAAMNKGNSGGALFDFDGSVIGMAQSIFSPNTGSVGVGFALPANVIKEVAQQIETTGSMTRGWLGAKLQDLTMDVAASLGLKETAGALITETVTGGPGAAAGLKAQDVILQIDDEKVTDSRSAARAVVSKAPDSKVEFKLWRERGPMTIRVQLGTLPKTSTPDTPPAEPVPPSNQPGGTNPAPAPKR